MLWWFPHLNFFLCIKCVYGTFLNSSTWDFQIKLEGETLLSKEKIIVLRIAVMMLHFNSPTSPYYAEAPYAVSTPFMAFLCPILFSSHIFTVTTLVGLSPESEWVGFLIVTEQLRVPNPITGSLKPSRSVSGQRQEEWWPRNPLLYFISKIEDRWVRNLMYHLLHKLPAHYVIIYFVSQNSKLKFFLINY